MNDRRAHAGMSLMELLVVVTLIAGVSASLYHSLSGGLAVWARSREVVVEEDIAIFFDKMARDLRNTLAYAPIHFEGGPNKVAFPATIFAVPDPRSSLGSRDRLRQIGQVEYYFDPIDDKLYRRQAHYGQVMNRTAEPAQMLVRAVDNVRFKYVYPAEGGEILSDKVLDTRPAGVLIDVDFTRSGKRKRMHRVLAIPVGS